MKHFFLFILALLLLSACKPEKEALPRHIESLNACIRSSMESNPEKPASEYAEFNLNGNRILINAGEDGYEQVNRIDLSFVTSGPVLNPGNDTSRQYLLSIGFDQPAPPPDPGQIGRAPLPESDEIYIALQKKENLSTIEFIDKYIQAGELQLNRKPLWDNTLDPALEDGFAIIYWCASCCPENKPPRVDGKTYGGEAFRFSSTSPSQDGYLACTKLERVDLGDKVWYQIEFEFACGLYTGYRPVDSAPVYEKVGQIEEGRMAVDFVVEK